MKISGTILNFIFLFISLSSCKYDASKMLKNKAVFESHQSDFEEVIALIKRLQVEKKLHSHTFLTQEAEAKLKLKLEELNIVSVELQASNCAEVGNIEVNLTMERGWLSPWYIPGIFQICYVPCNHQTHEGYEYYDGYHRNIYGLGNNWMMYSDTDLF